MQEAGITVRVFVVIWALITALCPTLIADDATKKEALAKFNKLQEERLRQGREPLTLLDLINTYGDEDKKQILRDTVKNHRIYFEIRGRWDLIDDPATALGWAYHEKEPFDKKVIEVLEKTFPLSQDRAERFRIASLLYRYNFIVGTEYLLDELMGRGDSEDAAIILALNREPRAYAGIKKVFEGSIPSSELIYALVGWGSEAGALLQGGFLASRGSSVDYLRVLGMAEYHVDRATLERIQQMYQNEQATTKVDAAAALIRLQTAKKEPLEYLVGKLENWKATPESQLFSVIKALSRQESVRTRELFTAIVESYASTPKPAYVQPTHVEAALALVKMGGEREKRVVVDMLRKMVKEGISDKRDVYTIARAVYDSGLPNSDAILNELIGDGFIATVRGMRELRSLPVRFLPVFSQPFVEKVYWVE